MKHSFQLAIFAILAVLPGVLIAQNRVVDLGIYNASGKSKSLEIKVKPTINITNKLWSAGVFTLRVPHDQEVSLSMAQAFPPYNINWSIEQTGINEADGYDYYGISFVNPVMVDWTANTEYVVAMINLKSGNGKGNFELVKNNAWTNAHNTNYYIELDGMQRARNCYRNASNVAMTPAFTTFSAIAQDDHTTKLDWTASTELGFTTYGVEHSNNGVDFRPIGKVDANGVESEFSFIQNNPNDGDNYFRLKMVEKNGSISYSPVRSVSFNGQDAAFTLLPNPTTGPLELISRNLSKYETAIRYQVTDNSGKLLLENQLSDEATKFDLSGYSGGVYYLNIMSDDQQIEKIRIVLTPK